MTKSLEKELLNLDTKLLNFTVSINRRRICVFGGFYFAFCMFLFSYASRYFKSQLRKNDVKVLRHRERKERNHAKKFGSVMVKLNSRIDKGAENENSIFG